MRSSGIIALLLLVCLPGWTQSSFEKIYEKYEGTDDMTSVSIKKRMFTLFSDISGDTEQEEESLMNILSDLDGIYILSYEGNKSAISSGLIKEAREVLDTQDFEELMTVKEEDENVNIMIREEEDHISELIMIVQEDTEATLISITGNIDLEKISRLSRKLNISGMEHLENID